VSCARGSDQRGQPAHDTTPDDLGLIEHSAPNVEPGDVVVLHAPVTVLTKGLGETQISVPELAQIIKGKGLQNRPLFDRMNALGYWIRVGDKYPNPVLLLDQQYHV
jgi:hypothetical protein